MSVDTKLMIHCLAKTLNSLGIEICDDTEKYIKSCKKSFAVLPIDDKKYYTRYALHITNKLTEYLTDISLFELNVDPKHEIDHDFRLRWKKHNIAHISLSHIGINIKDIIPEKLMRICKYKRNTKICKQYTISYKKINDVGYRKIKSVEKYSQISKKKKDIILLEPICELVLKTLSKKRKCAANLYNHLFAESDRIVIKLYKNRFIIYDFGKKMNDVESFRMKLVSDNTIIIIFNNQAKFLLNLQTNGSEIKNHLSLK